MRRATPAPAAPTGTRGFSSTHTPLSSQPQSQSQSVAATASASSSSSSDSSRGSSSSGQTGGADADADADAEEDAVPKGWWARWTHELPSPPRWSAAWYREMALVFTVFGVTGSSSMYLVKPLVKDVFGIDGSMMDGPWAYRLICIAVLMPSYSMMLVTFGTLAGRHHYFKRVALRMWGRLLPLHKLGIVSKPAPIARIKQATPAAVATQTKPPTPS